MELATFSIPSEKYTGREFAIRIPACLNKRLEKILSIVMALEETPEPV